MEKQARQFTAQGLYIWNDSYKVSLSLFGPSDDSLDISHPSGDVALLRRLTARADGSFEGALSVSELTEQISPVEPGGLVSTADGPGRLFPPTRTARAACPKANSGQTPNHRSSHSCGGSYSCNFVIDTKSCAERTNPEVLGYRKSIGFWCGNRRTQLR